LREPHKLFDAIKLDPAPNPPMCDRVRRLMRNLLNPVAASPNSQAADKLSGGRRFNLSVIP